MLTADISPQAMQIAIALRSMLDLLLPRYCCGCGRRLALDEKAICQVCLTNIPHFYVEDSFRAASVEDLAIHPAIGYMGAYASYRRKNLTANIVHSLKYYRNPEAGIVMGQMAARARLREGIFDGVDMLVPIPITWRRRMQRGYNQAELIARGISKVTGVPVRTDIMRRRRHTESQTHFEFHERMERQTGIFEFARGGHEAVSGKCVMLIDDVITTTATMRAATSVLLTGKDTIVRWFAWAWTT